ncbi:retinoic acid receptor responder protein 3-like [Lates japonicus]|uniref:Retinoic acid receptor responder protein 3-like protein n=1 Tax=Lates japonicus TaxID=270547 RepID=A0AAD3RIW6_LATJO|nr:retinoic acid receptor responder protein 3-like protein [Lates japonicus]GLD70006.1 retinoic acid receptor responder protein 3-like protein [Lates japonicus]
MDLLGNWNSMFSQMTWRQTDQSVSTAEIGDLIEFVNPWLGLSLWGVYVGEGHVIHFGVGDENMTQKACRSFLQQMAPKSSGDRVLKKTRICTQRITDIKVPPGTRIRVNNNKHNLVLSTQEAMRHRCETFLHQEFKYDLMNFNSEHFATFVRYGHAVCNQIPFKKKNEAHKDTTQTLQMIMQQRMETET